MSAVDQAIGLAMRVATLPFVLAAGAGREVAATGVRTGRAIAVSSEPALRALLEDIVTTMMSAEVIDWLMARVEATGAAQRVVDRVLSDGVMEQIADRVLAGPELDRVMEVAFRGRLPEEVVEQLLSSEALWILIDEIVQSPTVTEAVTHQSLGLAEQVGAKTRDRSREADARLQRLARRIGRRRRTGGDAPDAGGVPRSGPIPGDGLR